jgi:hypothetical protein
MNLLANLGGLALGHVGEAAQRKAGRLAYLVFRNAFKVSRGATRLHDSKVKVLPAWEDLTQNEQEVWIGSVGTVGETEMER